MLDVAQETGADILVVDDEAAYASNLAEGLQRLKHRVEVVHSGEEAVERLRRRHYDVVVAGLELGPPANGMAVLHTALHDSPGTEVIILTAHPSVATCRAALQQGAFDYIEKSEGLDDVRAVVQRAARKAHPPRRARRAVKEGEGHAFEGIIGASPEMQRILETVRRIAPSNLTVLIQGESGTGKELIAQAIHQHSRRRGKRFVALNCAGLSESLLEDELFGHVKGAYTGATADRKGRFEYADGGTLFLDEVGDMPIAMQAKLLRVLENGEVVPVGTNEPAHVDVRVISATNVDLGQRVKEKRFREDLYFRVNSVTVTLPPLRERREDIPPLVEHFIRQANLKHGTRVTGVSPDVQRLLVAFDWPGNVRQLRNAVENMVVLAGEGKLSPNDLPNEFRGTAIAPASRITTLAGVSLNDAERELIRNTLKMVGGNRQQAAGILGIGERTLYRKIKEYGLAE